MSIVIEPKEIDEELGKFIDASFETYAQKHGITCNYEDFSFVAKDGDTIVGTINGHSYYNSVNISDLIVSEEYRGQDIGTMLVKKVEDEYRARNMEYICLTTYAFQAREFYEKLGYEVEYVRKSKNEKLTKYFLIKYDI